MTQKQHYITKSIIKNWITNNNQKSVIYFNGNKIERIAPSYRNIFYYNDEWDNNIESLMNLKIESPVTNNILKKRNNLSIEDENKLVAFAFLQSVRKVHHHDSNMCINLINNFMEDNNYIYSVVDYKFQNLKEPINLPEQGLISYFDFNKQYVVHVLPISPYEILILMNKNPYIDFKEIKIDEKELVQLSFGLTNQKIVIPHAMNEDVINKKQKSNDLFYEDNKEKMEYISTVEQQIPNIAYLIQQTTGVLPTKEEAISELNVSQDSPDLYRYTFFLRFLAFIHKENLSENQFESMLIEINNLKKYKMEELNDKILLAKDMIAQALSIEAKNVDSKLEEMANQFYKDSGLRKREI